VRRGTKLIMSTATLVVVSVGLRAGAQPNPPAGAAPSARISPPSPGPARTAAPTTSRPSTRGTLPGRRPHGTARPTPATVTVTGDLVDTAYGPIQVQVALQGDRITLVRTPTRPTGSGHTQDINSYAIPLLNQETLAAQSANIDTVSGASFTSAGYRRSLQSALDAAHRAGPR